METTPRDLATVRDLAQQASDRARTQIMGDDGRSWLVVPDGHGGMKLLEIPDEGRSPTQKSHISQTVTLVTTDSIIGYVNDFKTPTTRLFADLAASGQGGSITAVLDYHSIGFVRSPYSDPNDPAIVPEMCNKLPGRSAHVVVYKLRDSEEWTRWSKISGKLMPQAEFVSFLEENMVDIENPSGADILEIARDFRAARKVNFSQTLHTQTGEVSFEYVAEAEAKSKSGHVEVPTKFQLRIPIFFGEPTAEVYAFLRWSIDDGSLKIGIELNRPVAVREAMFVSIAATIADRVNAPIHFGSYSAQR